MWDGRGSLGRGKGGKGKGGDKSPAWSSQDLGSTLGLHVAIIIDKTMFMMLSSWHSHCESSPGSFDECRTAPGGCWPSDQAKRLKTLIRLNVQLSYSVYIHHGHLWPFTHFTIPRRVGLIKINSAKMYTCVNHYANASRFRQNSFCHRLLTLFRSFI